METIQSQIPSLVQEYTDIYYQDMEEKMKMLQIAKEKSFEKDQQRLNNDIQ